MKKPAKVLPFLTPPAPKPPTPAPEPPTGALTITVIVTRPDQQKD